MHLTSIQGLIILPLSFSEGPFILFLILIMPAWDNHFLTVELKHFSENIWTCDDVNGADPLTTIYSVTLSIPVFSYFNGGLSWMVNFTRTKGFSTPFRPRQEKKRSCPSPSTFCCCLPSFLLLVYQYYHLYSTSHTDNPTFLYCAAFKSFVFFCTNTPGKETHINKNYILSFYLCALLYLPMAELSPQHPDPHWALSRETSLSSISTLVASCWIVVVAGQPHAAFGMLMRWVNVTWTRRVSMCIH